MLAEQVLNGNLTNIIGTLNDSPTKGSTDPTMRATTDPSKIGFIESRTFKYYNKPVGGINLEHISLLSR
ncbi:hypothetical protein LPYR103PRE_25280 [Segatella asaccharophila]